MWSDINVFLKSHLYTQRVSFDDIVLCAPLLVLLSRFIFWLGYSTIISIGEWVITQRSTSTGNVVTQEAITLRDTEILKGQKTRLFSFHLFK